jgi:hypothetical protein
VLVNPVALRLPGVEGGIDSKGVVTTALLLAEEMFP